MHTSAFPGKIPQVYVSLTLLQMSSPNPDWPVSAAGEDGQASLCSLHTASYHRYFLSSCPNLFHIVLLTPVSQVSSSPSPRQGFSNYWSAFAPLEPKIIYLLDTSQSTPLPTPSQGWGCPRQVSMCCSFYYNSFYYNFKEQTAELGRQSPVVSHVTVSNFSLPLLLL